MDHSIEQSRSGMCVCAMTPISAGVVPSLCANIQCRTFPAGWGNHNRSTDPLTLIRISLDSGWQWLFCYSLNQAKPSFSHACFIISTPVALPSPLQWILWELCEIWNTYKNIDRLEWGIRKKSIEHSSAFMCIDCIWVSSANFFFFFLSGLKCWVIADRGRVRLEAFSWWAGSYK